MRTRSGSIDRCRTVAREGAWVAALAVLACTIWTGCSVEKHYKTLSFFFDGVPDPEARARLEAAGLPPKNLRDSPTYSVHKPYAEERCNDCHAGQFQLTPDDSGLCLKCHKEVPSEHAKMHGPVAAGACLWCHNPHESAEAFLLKQTSWRVCAQCHEKGSLDAVKVPAHGEERRNCLECHSGHGGKAAYFLREGVSRVASPPSTSSSPAAPTPATPGEAPPK